ncbi:hypothetical protein NW765_002204 [Fusarium oxysporum]|nr:hypothetical protein NW765_002204 [Fusarium oxysporum]
MQRLPSFNSPSSPSASASSNCPVADSTDQEKEGRKKHPPPTSTSTLGSVPTFTTPSNTTTTSTTDAELDTDVSVLAAAAAAKAAGEAYNRVTITGRKAYDSRRISEAPAWRHELSIPNLASIAPFSDFATSFSPASTTGAIRQSSLSTAGSPRGLSASTRGLPQTPIPAKRPSAPFRGEPVMHPSPIKKARTGASPPRKVELPNQAANLEPSARGKQQGPLSPLFFSHRQRGTFIVRPAFPQPILLFLCFHVCERTRLAVSRP